MGTTTIADLQDTIPVIISEARFIEQFRAVMRGLSWTIRKGNGTTVNIPYFEEVEASALTEGIDMTSSETMEDVNVQVTPAEVGLKIILTDSVIEDDQEDLKRAAGRLMGDAYEKKRDKDLLALFSSAATTLAGSATLTMGHAAASRATLAGNVTTSGGPAPTPYVGVIHPFSELDLVDVVTPVVPTAATTNVTGTALTDTILREYSIGRLFGMPIVIDGNITVDTNPNARGAFFAMGTGGAIIYVSAREPTVEPERDASLRAWELNYVGRYGVGLYRNGYIVSVNPDATAPA